MTDKPQTIPCTLCGKEVEMDGLAEMFDAIIEIENFVCEDCQKQYGGKIQEGVAEA